jgi:hypothetical protein
MKRVNNTTLELRLEMDAANTKVQDFERLLNQNEENVLNRATKMDFEILKKELVD